MKHTPGPWKIYNSPGSSNSGHYDGYLRVEIQAGCNIIRVEQAVAGNSFTELVANAQLMASAPELLAENARLRRALDDLLNAVLASRDYVAAHPDDDETIARAEAALAGKEGK